MSLASFLPPTSLGEEKQDGNSQSKKSSCVILAQPNLKPPKEKRVSQRTLASASFVHSHA